MQLGLILTSFTLGLRHGVDWDHIAAIADLSSSAESRRRGFALSFLYALGHAAVVLALGVLIVVFGASLPSGVDVWMGRFVGVTLVAMGLWIVVDLFRSKREFRLRSRWILILNGTFRGMRRVRDASARRKVVVQHDHLHEHEDQPDHGELMAHDHAHMSEVADVPQLVEARKWPRAMASVGTRKRGPHKHRHQHRHDLSLAGDALAGPGNGTAVGIGALHGVGFESPTQIALFVASTSLAGLADGLMLLLVWVVGLIVANACLAGLASFGLLQAERNFAIYAGIALVVGVLSIAMGLLFLFGSAPSLDLA